MRSLPTLVCHLLDVVGRPYDGIDHLVMHDVHETMFDPGERDYPLVATGAVAQTPRDVIANLNLDTGLAEIDIAAVMQFEAHHVRHGPVKPLPIAYICRSEVNVR